MSGRGTYVLVVDLPQPTTLEVGALGDLEFDAGPYAYVGSAFGPGGFGRIDRHRELARGERDARRRSNAPTRSPSLRSRDRHWHIDYLLGHDATRLEAAFAYPDADRECELATSLPGDPVDGFGASDCDCPGHLLAAPDAEAVREAAVAEDGRPHFE